MAERDDSAFRIRCYHLGVKQLIARIDDRLHARLKARAHAEGRSVNALVTEVLETATPELSERELLRERIRAAGMLVEPPPPEGHVPTLDEAIALTRGAGRVASAAIEADRAAR